MKCPKCGCQLPPDSDFCQYCGEVLTSPTEVEEVIAPVVSAPELATIPTEGSPIPVDTAPKEKKESKGRYCKHCGGVILPETKKCVSCGKQHFRLPKRTGTISIAVVAILLAGLNVFQYISHSKTAATIKKLNAEIGSLQLEVLEKDSEIKELKADAERYQDLWEKASDKAWFLDSSVVIVSDDGTNRYHKYDCDEIDWSYYWAYNTEYAIYRGYRACGECH